MSPKRVVIRFLCDFSVFNNHILSSDNKIFSDAEAKYSLDPGLAKGNQSALQARSRIDVVPMPKW